MEKKIREYKIKYVQFTSHSPEGIEGYKVVWAETEATAIIEYNTQFNTNGKEIKSVELY